MNILLPLLLCTLSGFGTFLGSLLVFIPKIVKSKNIYFLLTISGIIMFELSIFELLPNNIRIILSTTFIPLGIILILIAFMVGVLVVTILDKKIEKGSTFSKIGILSFISLVIHNFPEGMATFMSSLIDTDLGFKLGIAIMIHNIPEGLCISLPYYIGGKKGRGLLLSFIASLSEIVGGLLGYVILRNYINEFNIAIILIFVAGLMITLSMNNIFKESIKDKKQFLLGIIIGTIILVTTLLLH